MPYWKNMKMNFKRTNVLKINFAATTVAFGEEQHDIAWQYTNPLYRVAIHCFLGC